MAVQCLDDNVPDQTFGRALCHRVCLYSCLSKWRLYKNRPHLVAYVPDLRSHAQVAGARQSLGKVALCSLGRYSIR